MCVTRRIFLVLVLHSICLCVIETGRVKRVVGGTEVGCGTQPRVASLRNATSNQHLCVATLLSPHFAITAAHCLTHSMDQYQLTLNNYCVKGHEVPKIELMEFIPNELYDKYSRAHDIALIRISLDFDDTAWLNSSVLPKFTLGLSGECTIFGYGYKDPEVKETTEWLQSGRMRVISLDECWAKLGPYVAPNSADGMMCAVGAGVDACQGDSGAPLICSGRVQSISSYGMSCAVPGLPGVFTSVPAHLSWINSILNS